MDSSQAMLLGPKLAMAVAQIKRQDSPLPINGLTRLSEHSRRQIEQARLQTHFDLCKRVYSGLTVRCGESCTQVVDNSPRLQRIAARLPPDRLSRG